MDPPVHPRLRATDTSDDLTSQPSTARPELEVEHPDSEVSYLPMPPAAAGALNAISPSQKPDRWIEAKHPVATSKGVAPDRSSTHSRPGERLSPA